MCGLVTIDFCFPRLFRVVLVFLFLVFAGFSSFFDLRFAAFVLCLFGYLRMVVVFSFFVFLTLWCCVDFWLVWVFPSFVWCLCFTDLVFFGCLLTSLSFVLALFLYFWRCDLPLRFDFLRVWCNIGFCCFSCFRSLVFCCFWLCWFIVSGVCGFDYFYVSSVSWFSWVYVLTFAFYVLACFVG